MDVHQTIPGGRRSAEKHPANDRHRPNALHTMSGRDGGDHLLRTLISRDPDGLLVVGRADQVIRFANPAARRWLFQVQDLLITMALRRRPGDYRKR